MILKKVKCECGKLVSPLEMVQHSYKCATFHRRWGSNILNTRYEKKAVNRIKMEGKRFSSILTQKKRKRRKR